MAEMQEIFVHTKIDVDEEEFLLLRRLFARMQEELVLLKGDEEELEHKLVGCANNYNWTRVAELTSELADVRLAIVTLEEWIEIGKGEQ